MGGVKTQVPIEKPKYRLTISLVKKEMSGHR